MTWTILCGNAKSVRRRLNATTIHKHFTQARTHTHNLPTRWNWAIKVAFNTSGTYKTEPLWGVRQITYFRVTLMSPKKKVTWLGTTVSKSSPFFLPWSCLSRHSTYSQKCGQVQCDTIVRQHQSGGVHWSELGDALYYWPTFLNIPHKQSDFDCLISSLTAHTYTSLSHLL